MLEDRHVGMARRSVRRVRAERKYVVVFVCPRCGREYIDEDAAKVITYGAKHLRACMR